MENLNCFVKDGVLQVNLIGRVDSANAQAVRDGIMSVIREGGAKSAIVDCSALSYISSAGLRVVLQLKKSLPDMKVVEVSPDVYEIFDMTGFTEMMTVEKAYRVIDVEGCEVIGQGANGKVYRIDRDTIVKVYLNPESLPEIHRERELARTAFVSGVPTAIPYDVVRISGGGYGSVFELLSAKSLAKMYIDRDLTMEEVIEKSADLLKLIHKTPVSGDKLPEIKKTAIGWVNWLKGRVPGDCYEKLLFLIGTIPDDDHMIHGDYHLKNVMVQSGECLLIDMDTISRGNIIFEFAAMFNAYVGFSELNGDVIRNFLGISREEGQTYWNGFLENYFAGRGKDEIALIEKKAQVIAYTRLLRRALKRGSDDGESLETLAAHYLAQLQRVLTQIDTLEI